MHFIPIALIQAAADNAVTSPWSVLGPLIGGSPVAAVLAYFMLRDQARRDKADAENVAQHKATQNKVDDVKEGYHGIREELIRKQVINGGKA